MSNALAGRVALVTGASRGIGHGIAIELAKLGAFVVGTATTSEGAARLEADICTAGFSGVGVVLDVADPEQVDRVVADIESRHGSIAILVNNAGITRDTLLIRMKDEDWTSVLQTNLSSVYRLSKSVAKGMMKGRFGRIVNVTSVVASSGNPGQGNYAAAKAGVEGFSRALALELGSRNVTVNCVAPGFIDTDMTKVLSAEQRGGLMQRIPLGRLGTVEEVAATVGFLASPAAGYITGATIHVNGGMYLA